MCPAVAAHSVEVIRGRVHALTLWSGGFTVGVSVGGLLAEALSELTDLATAFHRAALLPLAAAGALRRGEPGPARRIA